MAQAERVALREPPPAWCCVEGEGVGELQCECVGECVGEGRGEGEAQGLAVALVQAEGV